MGKTKQLALALAKTIITIVAFSHSRSIQMSEAFMLTRSYSMLPASTSPSLTLRKMSSPSEDSSPSANTRIVADGENKIAEKKLTLEEKMKRWEASEEEIRAASLGGVVPQPQRERTDAFDVGLYIAFPIMVVTGLIFAFFPFIMGSIDVGDIGEIPRV